MNNSEPKKDTLVSLAISYSEGSISRNDLIEKIKDVDLAVQRKDPDGTVWWDGESDNTIPAVAALGLGRIGHEKVYDFLDVLREI